MNNQEFREKTAKILGVIEHYTSYKGVSIADCIKNGFVVVHKEDKEPVNIDTETFEILKNDRDIFSHTLFGNFSIPENMSDEEYYTHQILHYFSTYGLESVGLNAMPYIPAKEIWKDDKAAQLLGDKDLSIKVYFQVEPDEYKQILKDYICNVRNPKNDLIGYYEYIIEEYGGELDEEDIRSYEIKAIYYDKTEKYPKNAIDMLRFIIYTITGNTLIIKNRNMRKSIQNFMYINTGNRSWGKDEKKYNKICNYILRYDWKKFASIFYRFKEIFLAFKGYNEEINHAINKIRKLAPTYHKPLEGLAVSNVIEMYLQEFYSSEEIADFIKTIDTRDIFKLMNAILNMNNEFKVIGIRNGRSFVKENTNHKDMYELDILYSVCIDILRDRYLDMKNKVFYIPDYIDYGLPISEKDMVGVYPNGTKICMTDDINKAISVGVAWKNLDKTLKSLMYGESLMYGDGRRVDIDLHLISAAQHFGWNASRKDDRNKVIYSGDMTDATNGAAEAFYIKNLKEDYIIDTRLFTANGPVDMKLFANKRPIVKREWSDSFKGYIYDPNENIIPEIPLTIHNQGLNIGLLTNGDLYLYNKPLNCGQVPNVEYSEKFINGLKEKFENNLLLSDIIVQLGGTIVDNIDDCKEDTIMLNPEVIDETTLFKIFEK